eukprot:4748591-Pyramimonas_sp.AAC.1
MNFTAASEATPSFGWNPSRSVRQPGVASHVSRVQYSTGPIKYRPSTAEWGVGHKVRTHIQDGSAVGRWVNHAYIFCALV